MTSPFPKPARRKTKRHDISQTAPQRREAREPAAAGGSESSHGAPRSGISRDAVESAGRPRSEDCETPLLPGLKPVLELLQSAPEKIDTIFLRKGRHSKDMALIADLCRARGVRFSLLEPPVFAGIYAGSSQGVVARLFEAGFVEFDDIIEGVMDAPLPLILALDQVRDPGNAGTLARTLYALGGAGLVVPRHNGVYLGAAASKAAAGALEQLPVAKVANLGQALDKAKKQGITIYGASSRDASGKENPRQAGAARETASAEKPQASVPCLDAFEAEFRLPAVLVLGSEEEGLRPGMEKRCDFFARIPMQRSFDSLNVAQAGAMLMAFISRYARRSHG